MRDTLAAMASLITVENCAKAPREPVTFHLEHEVYCAQAGDCGCIRQPAGRLDYDPEKKKKIVVATKQRLPRAVTLMASGTPGSSVDLHPAVQKTADFQRLLAARKVRVKPVADGHSPSESPPAPTPQVPEAPTAKSGSPKRTKPDTAPAAPSGG